MDKLNNPVLDKFKEMIMATCKFMAIIQARVRMDKVLELKASLALTPAISLAQKALMRGKQMDMGDHLVSLRKAMDLQKVITLLTR
tara:strand:- start:164 stop:421 length:258 start_codon:yes stop_codon:yes gene_type:complete